MGVAVRGRLSQRMGMMHFRAGFLPLAFGLCAAACGGGAEAGKPAQTGGDTSSSGGSGHVGRDDGDNGAWKKKSQEEKMNIMKTVVLPKMKEKFVAFDAKRFSNFSCATCHGEGANKGDFVMPNPKLPRLWTTSNFQLHREADPEATKFMMEQVKPEMAKLLGLPLYDVKTKKGFGCLHCHEDANEK